MNIGSIGWIGSAGLAVAVAFLWHSNSNLNETLGEQQHALAQEKFANETNVNTIYSLIMRNNTCIEDQRVSIEAGEKTASELREEIAAIRAQQPQIVREEVYRDPSCAQLGDIDINAVCPVLAVGVRQHALAVGGSANR